MIPFRFQIAYRGFVEYRFEIIMVELVQSKSVEMPFFSHKRYFEVLEKRNGLRE